MGSGIYIFCEHALLRFLLRCLFQSVLDDVFLESLGETWTYFYTEILPTLQYLLQAIKVTQR